MCVLVCEYICMYDCKYCKYTHTYSSRKNVLLYRHINIHTYPYPHTCSLAHPIPWITLRPEVNGPDIRRTAPAGRAEDSRERSPLPERHTHPCIIAY